MNTVNRLQTLLARELNVSVAALLPDARMFEDLGVDSLALAELAYAVEREFGVQIDERELDALTSIAQVAAYIDRRASARVAS